MELRNVELHVNAKRYMTAIDRNYFETLSLASVRSLALQGGPFGADLARGFIALPHASGGGKAATVG
jgi:predicted HD phosphohydrolase